MFQIKHIKSNLNSNQFRGLLALVLFLVFEKTLEAKTEGRRCKIDFLILDSFLTDNIIIVMLGTGILIINMIQKLLHDKLRRMIYAVAH